MKIDENPPETEKLRNGTCTTSGGSTELSSEISEEDIILALSDDDGKDETVSSSTELKKCNGELSTKELVNGISSTCEKNPEANITSSKETGDKTPKPNSISADEKNCVINEIETNESENKTKENKQVSNKSENELKQLVVDDSDFNNLLVEDDRKFEELSNGPNGTSPVHNSSDEAEEQNGCQSPISEEPNKSLHICENSVDANTDEVHDSVSVTNLEIEDKIPPEITEKVALVQMDIDVEDTVIVGEDTVIVGEDTINLSKTDVLENGVENENECSGQKRSAEEETDHDKRQSKKLKASQINTLGDKQLIALTKLQTVLQTKVLKSLNRTELEQLLVQKICEAIVDKSELGDLRHSVQVLEQKVETWRNNSVQLAKQLRDLEIVTKRCAQDVKNGKEVIPLKNTRSVGLQVNTTVPLRLKVDNVTNQQPVKRRQQCNNKMAPSPNATVNIQGKVTINGVPNGLQTPSPPKTIKTIPPRSPQITNPILSKALSTKDKIPSPTTTQPSVPKFINIPLTSISGSPMTVAANKGIIDLTDEDENKTTQPATTSIATTAILATNTTAGGPRFMYVVPNSPLQQGILAQGPDPNRPGQPAKAIMFKLNSGSIAPSGRAANYRVISGGPQNGAAVSLVPQLNNGIRQVPPLRITTQTQPKPAARDANSHPAPLPTPPIGQIHQNNWKPLPPRPILTIRKGNDGIILSWKMPANLSSYEEIASYQLFAYQETNVKPSTDMWRKVGDVKALALPMACTLSQFADGNKYHFAVRAVDIRKRLGNFSAPEEIMS